jgi:hypothetical protein
VSRNRLNEHWRHTNGIAVRRGVGDGPQEFEELGGLEN